MDNVESNSCVYVGIFYLDQQPALYVGGEATKYQAARLLPTVSTEHLWGILCLCWISCYPGPSAVVPPERVKIFLARVFKGNARTFSVNIKSIPI